MALLDLHPELEGRRGRHPAHDRDLIRGEDGHRDDDAQRVEGDVEAAARAMTPANPPSISVVYI
jgi:hypothetical protein